jgi:3-oxoacyl-[acyl-carrier-protein] synthase II
MASNQLRRVAVTGFGAVTPLGNSAEQTWQGLVDGRSGIGRITTFQPDGYEVQIAGEVRDLDLDPYVPKRLRHYLSRAGGFGAVASIQALAAAGIDADSYPPEERGIAMGGSVGRPELRELADAHLVVLDSGGRELYRHEPLRVVMRAQNTPLSIIGLLACCGGPVLSTSTACSSSAQAIGEAYRLMQDGEARMMLAGGYDALTSYFDVLGFSLLGALAADHNDDPERASRPFDRERSGFVIGEGAVVAVLEDMESARQRGATVLAEIVGYASSLNAYRITDAPPDGGGVDLAMAAALSESGLGPGGIDYVVAHGTGTAGNDLSETVALKTVFGKDAYRLAISSPKSMTGHLTAAAGALNLLAAVRSITDQVVPPTINLDHPDPLLDLDYVANRAREMPVRAAMANSFAFGGTNGSLVVTRPLDS